MRRQGVPSRQVCKRVDGASRRRENAVFPVRRKPPMWVRGNFHALTSSRHYARRRVSERNRRKAAALSAEMSAQHPQGCILDELCYNVDSKEK